jgi:hypothetical protein
LKHVWSHPSFEEVTFLQAGAMTPHGELGRKAEKRVRDWCRSIDAYGFDYHTCIELFEEGESGSFSLVGRGPEASTPGMKQVGRYPSAILDAHRTDSRQAPAGQNRSGSAVPADKEDEIPFVVCAPKGWDEGMSILTDNEEGECVKCGQELYPSTNTSPSPPAWCVIELLHGVLRPGEA